MELIKLMSMITVSTRDISPSEDESLPELSSQTPVHSYFWPRMSQVADEVVSPPCFRSSCLRVHFRDVHCPLCLSYSQPVAFESCNVSSPSMYSLLYKVYAVFTPIWCLIQVLRLWSRRVMPSMTSGIGSRYYVCGCAG